MKRAVLCSGLVCGVLLASPAGALKVAGLYEASVPVADQTAGSRLSGIRSALSAVLVKLTGDKNAANRVVLQAIMDDAKRYVLQYRYYQNASPSTADVANTELLVLFDEVVLKRVLRDNDIAIWGQERPSVLLWLVAQTATGDRIIGLGDETAYLNTIDEQARARGIPMLFPLLDIEDTSRIRIDDIRAGAAASVESASNRYRADVILLGSIEPIRSALFEIRWNAITQGQTFSWVSQAEQVELALAEGIDEIADRLVNRYVSPGAYTEREAVTLVVHDVDTLDQYARVLRYLESLNSVTDIKVRRLQGNSITFDVTNLGGRSAIAQAVSLGDTLTAIPNRAGSEFQLKKH